MIGYMLINYITNKVRITMRKAAPPGHGGPKEEFISLWFFHDRRKTAAV